MDRVEQGISTPVTIIFELGGVPTDPSPATATVTVTRLYDGEILHLDDATTHGDTGEFSYRLSADDTESLGVLQLDWTATLDGEEQTLRTRVEVVGGFYFTVSEFRSKYAGDEAVAALSAEQIADAREIAEDIIERECNVAFVRRSKTLTVSGNWTTRLDIPLYKIRSVEAVSIDGEVVVSSAYRIGEGGIYRSSSWPRNPGNVAITVTHGFDSPPAHLKDAAMTLTYHRAVKGPIDDRATSIPAGEAGGTISLLTPGVGASVTGIPDVDAAIIANRLLPPSSVGSVVLADAANTYPDPLEDFANG